MARQYHDGEASPHHHEQILARARDFLLDDKDEHELGPKYGAIVTHLHEGGVQTGVFVWSGDELWFSMHVEGAGRQLIKFAREELLETLSDSKSFKRYLREFLLPGEGDEDAWRDS